MKKIILMLIATLFPALISIAATLDNKTLQLKNQRNSELTITFHPTSKNAGRITGTFKTAVASKNCLDVIGKPQPITGFYTGNALSLTVSYPTCGAAIAFVGNLDAQNNIETLWIDAHQGSHVDNKDWNTRMIGSDKFTIISSQDSNQQRS